MNLLQHNLTTGPYIANGTARHSMYLTEIVFS